MIKKLIKFHHNQQQVQIIIPWLTILVQENKKQQVITVKIVKKVEDKVKKKTKEYMNGT